MKPIVCENDMAYRKRLIRRLTVATGIELDEIGRAIGMERRGLRAVIAASTERGIKAAMQHQRNRVAP